MNTNIKSLITFSKFAQKAKKHLGLIKSVDMFNNPEYANDILIKATLSGDDELVALSKIISNEIKVDFKLISSVEIYINSLDVKNSSAQFLHESKYFLIKLSSHLNGINVNGASYREAVEKLLSEVEKKERSFCINLAREFYTIWRSGYKSFDDKDTHEESRLSEEKEELIKLWNNVDNEFFSDFESWPLNVYIESMRQIKVPEKDINIRAKIAKLITISMRGNKNNKKVEYRSAVDSIKFLFTSKELNDFYLVVSREYYRFWVGETPKISII